MNARAMFAIIRKDLKVVSQNKGVTIPIMMMVLIMFVVMPWIITQVPALMQALGGSAAGSIGQLGLNIPESLQQEFAGYDENQRLIVYVLVYMLAPLFMIVPLMVSQVIAADSFAGEKERKTMEALLYTPTTDRELFVAKLLSGWLTAIGVALVGFGLYVVMVNAAAWPSMGRIFFPNAMWLVLIFWVVPALPGLALGIMVQVSARAQGFQDAYQVGNILVLPIVILLFGQVSGVMSFSVGLLVILGLAFWLLAGLLIWWGSRSFSRGKLLGA